MIGIGIIMKFRPLHDRIALRRIEGDTKTTGGIIIPDTAAEKPQQGEVIAVGPGARGRFQPARASSNAEILIVAKLQKVSEIAYGRTTRSPWRMAPHVYTTFGT